MEKMNSHYRFLDWMNYKSIDRLPLYEWLGYWPETVDRWKAEELPPGVNIFEYFRFDKREYSTRPKSYTALC